MSTFAEKAREEADRVEAEERELEAEAGEEADSETAAAEDEPAAEPGEEPAAEVFEVDAKALERELKRHDKAMLATLGPEWANMEPCGQCGGMGAVPPDFVPVPEMLEDPDVLVCKACNGFGQRVTPSLNPQYAAAPCTVCNSLGYRTRTEIDAEREHAAIMAEQERQRQAIDAQYPMMPTSANGSSGYPPPPPSPVWNQALGAWEFPTVDSGAGVGVVSPLP